MKKVLVWLLACSLSIVMLGGCGGSTEAESAGDSASGDSDTYKIGVTMALDEFNTRVKHGLEAALEEYKDKVEMEFVDSGVDIMKQASDVDTFIAKNVDLVIIFPLEADAGGGLIEKMNEANIPVICINIEADAGEYVFVGAKYYESGKLQGEYLAEHLKENAKVCYITGSLGMSATRDLEKGLKDALKDRTDIEWLEEQAGDWEREKGMKLMENWLMKHKEIDAVIAQSDPMALGAIEALQSAGREGVIVCGSDASSDACDALENGMMTMTMTQHPYDQGKAALETAVKILEGQEYEKEYIIDYTVITKENVEEARAIK